MELELVEDLKEKEIENKKLDRGYVATPIASVAMLYLKVSGSTVDSNPSQSIYTEGSNPLQDYLTIWQSTDKIPTLWNQFFGFFT